MTAQNKQALISAFRTVLSLLAAMFFASFVANPILAAGLDLLSVAIVAYWSLCQKSDTEQSAFSMLMGPLRNLAVSLIAYASTRGWLSPEQAQALLPAVITIAVALWGVEQKYLAARALPALFLALTIAPAVMLYGCASSGDTGDQLQEGLTAAEAGYAAYCIAEPKAAACSPANAAKVQAAEQTAQDAIDTYKEAEANGDPTQALLDHAQALITDVATLIADLKNGKHRG